MIRRYGRAKPTIRRVVPGASFLRSALARVSPSLLETSSTNCERRPSISSATRYRTWPRFIAVREAHGSAALRAARTASRRSLRDARLALASSSPRELVTR